MRNIAIFVSGRGLSAERIITLFNEGNRLRTVFLLESGADPELLKKINEVGMPVFSVSEGEWQQKSEEVKDLLKNFEVNLIVLDHFRLPVSVEMIEAGGGKITEVTDADVAPREVVSALESELRRPTVEKIDEKPVLNEDKTPEQEWAEALKINFVPPRVPVTPPPVPENDGSDEKAKDEKAPEILNKEATKREEDNPVPMPSTFLIWSVLCTVFCCFIPGIVAIVFSSQVSSKYYAGDIEGARQASRRAEIWIIVSVVLGAVFGALYLPFMLIGN